MLCDERFRQGICVERMLILPISGSSSLNTRAVFSRYSGNESRDTWAAVLAYSGKPAAHHKSKYDNKRQQERCQYYF